MKIFEVTENISHTSKRLRDIEQERDVKIGSDEWFKLWFSLPYLKKNLKESSGHSYLLQLERDSRAGMLVLHILDQKTGKRTEVRGKLGYETNGYDPEDKLHQILDKVGKSASVSDLMNGDVVSINPRHPQGPAALKVAHDLTNEADLTEAFDQPYDWTWQTRDFDRRWTVKFNDVEVVIRRTFGDTWDLAFSRNNKKDVTGEGDQFKIFATVIDILGVFIKQRKPSIVTFSAEKDDGGNTGSRSKLYSAMVKRFAAHYGYTTNETSSSYDENDPGYVEYTLKRIEKNQDVKESNPFTDARMNAIKAGKTEFTVGGKTYKVTGDTSDEREAVANEKLDEETGKEMLKIFRGMHHDAGMNKDMDRYIQSHDWKLGNFTPDMFPSEEEFFDYDDPFDRVIDIDYSHRVNISAPIIVGPRFSDGKYSVIDGNHRAATAQKMGKTIQAYFPVEKTTEARTFAPQQTPMQDLVNSYLFFTSFGQMGTSDGAKSSESAEKIKEVIRALSQSHKNLQNLDKQTLEKNKNKILTHIHEMMNYAIAYFKEHLTPDNFQAKRKQINDILTKYNNLAFTNENFADGKNPGRKGLAKRSGVNTRASVSDLRKTAKNSSGEKQRMAHWLANMKSGKDK